MTNNLGNLSSGIEEVLTVKSLSGVVLDSPIACLAFAPNHGDMVVVGTYQLQEGQSRKDEVNAQQSRNGGLEVFEMVERSFHHRFAHIAGYGVLDLKFSPKKDDTFAVAGSNGTLETFLLNVPNTVSLTKVHSLQICDTSVLVLSLDWCTIAGYENRLALSLSDGRLVVVTLTLREPCIHFKAHSLEAWSVAWDSLDSAISYSGGDDSAFCIHKNWIQQLENETVCQKHEEAKIDEKVMEYVPFSRDLKLHGAGVTAILPIGQNEHGDVFVITGSYDEYLRVLKRRSNSKTWNSEVEMHLGGGVWRLNLIDKLVQKRMDKSCKLRILASCMHAGPKVVQLELSNEDTWNASILAQFLEHESMNYASDVKASDEHENGVLTVVSSSFYDRKLCVWCLDNTRDW